ncbi:MAG: hypothetical protein HUJ98_04135 [Bacteroidaceae bacterium]|nr:hypothetical protein [Bacteroidaceae bacterium]
MMRVKKLICEEDGSQITDFDFSQASSVAVNFVTFGRKFAVEFYTSSNKLYMKGKHDFKTGAYGIELKVVDLQGRNLGFYERNMFELTLCTSDCTQPYDIELGLNVYYQGLLGLYVDGDTNLIFRIEELERKVGNLDNLQTLHKDNLVDAINEVKNSILQQQSLANLSDVVLSDLAVGQTLKFNGQKWVNSNSSSNFDVFINGVGNFIREASKGENSLTLTRGELLSSDVVAALGYSPFNSNSFTKSNIKNTLGISEWALAASKPSYTLDDIPDGIYRKLTGEGDSYFEKVNVGTESNPKWAVKPKDSMGLFSDDFVTAFGAQSGGGGGGGASMLSELDDVILTGPTNGQALIYNGEKWMNSSIPQSTTFIIEGAGNFIRSASHGNNILTLTRGSLLSADVIAALGYTPMNKADFDDLFSKVNVGTAQNPEYVIRANYGMYSVDFLSAFGFQSGGGGTGGVTKLAELDDVLLTSPANGNILTYDGTRWINTTIPETITIHVLGTGDFARGVTYTNNTLTINRGSLSSADVTTALGFTPFNNANFTKANIKSTLGISDWALASVKPTYSLDEVLDGSTRKLSDYLKKAVFDDLFEKVNVGTSSAPIYAIRAKYGLYSDDFVTAFGAQSGGGSGGVSTLAELDDVQITSLATNQILQYNGSKWVNAAAPSITKSQIESVLTGNITSHTHSQYLTAHQTLYTLTLQRNGTSVGTYKPNADQTLNINACTSITTPTGLSAASLTSEGVIALSFASGYSIPTTTKQTAWDNHAASTSNPHSVTASQVGLGNVTNLAASGYFTALSLSTSSLSATIGGTTKTATVPTWNQNTTGYSAKVLGSYTSGGGQQGPGYFGKNRIGFLMMNTAVNSNSQYKDWMIMDCYNGSDVGGAVAIGVNRQALGAYIMRSTAERTSWDASAELIGTHNYTTYTVKKDGTGASGTWGISISGNAGSSTKLATEITLWGKSFNGAANITGALSSANGLTPGTDNTYNIGSASLHYKNVYATWIGTSSSVSRALSFGTVGANDIYINTSHNVGIGTTSPSQKLHVSGSILATAEIYAWSDMRRKDVVSPMCLGLQSIADAPLFRFRWKNKNDNKMHIGTSAQYWNNVAGELVSGDDVLSLNYAVLGTAIGITLARKVQELENEINKLKYRN